MVPPNTLSGRRMIERARTFWQADENTIGTLLAIPSGWVITIITLRARFGVLPKMYRTFSVAVVSLITLARKAYIIGRYKHILQHH